MYNDCYAREKDLRFTAYTPRVLRSCMLCYLLAHDSRFGYFLQTRKLLVKRRTVFNKVQKKRDSCARRDYNYVCRYDTYNSTFEMSKTANCTYLPYFHKRTCRSYTLSIDVIEGWKYLHGCINRVHLQIVHCNRTTMNVSLSRGTILIAAQQRFPSFQHESPKL